MAILGEIGPNFALITGSRSSFAGIIPDAVFEESKRDGVVVTDHPVERGAAITDHAFVKPAVLEMRCGFSDSSAGTDGYVTDIYQQLLQLMGRREPFSITTPHRAYKDMLLVEVTARRDQRTYAILGCELAFRQILITQTQTTKSDGASPDKGDQSSPEKTGATDDSGVKSAVGTSSDYKDGAFANGFSTAGTDVNSLGQQPDAGAGGNFPGSEGDAGYGGASNVGAGVGDGNFPGSEGDAGYSSDGYGSGPGGQYDAMGNYTGGVNDAAPGTTAATGSGAAVPPPAAPPAAPDPGTPLAGFGTI